MTADEERNRIANVEGTRNAVGLANALERGTLSPRLLDRRRRHVQGPVPRGHVRRGPEARPSLPPDQVRVREARPNPDHHAVAGLPPGDRRRQLADRRDGQDRRALLLLHRDQDGPALPAGLVPADRPRARLHQHRPGRLRGRRRWTTSPTRPGWTARPSTSPPQVPALRRRHEHDRQGRSRAAAVDADRLQAAQGAAQGNDRDAHAAARGQGRAQGDAGRLRDPRRGPRLHRADRRVRHPGHRAGAGRVGHRGAAAGELRRQAVGLLGAQPRS